jgi:uncharacterized protein YjeT (DUF2065 family)
MRWPLPLSGRMAEQLPRLADEHLRIFGVAALAIGVGLVYLARHL